MTPLAYLRRRAARRLSPVVTALALAIGFLAVPLTAQAAVAPADTAADSAGVQWSVSPADADGGDGRISLRHALAPGETATDSIAVTNSGTVAADFLVQSGDGLVGADGAFDIAAGEPEDAGAWMQIDGLDADLLHVEAGETRILPVSIAVPADATPGDHPAGIVVGLTSATDSVSVTHRIGVRLHLQVTGDLAPAMSVTDVRSSFTPSWFPFAPGTLAVDYTVTNDGNVRLGAAPTVIAAGPLGMAGARAAAEPAELLPGSTASHRVELQVWPLAALFGGVSVQPSTIGEDRTSLPDAASESFQSLAVSWTGLAVIALLILIIVFVMRRRAARRTDAAVPVEIPAAENRDEVAAVR